MIRYIFMICICFVVSDPVEASSDVCAKLLAKYKGSQAGLELLRMKSSEEYKKRLSGDFNPKEAYADDLIPRLEWEIGHITSLYVANKCDVERLTNYYIDEVLKGNK